MNDAHGQCLFPNEKEAIQEARKHALAIGERWRRTINTLDARYDAIDDAEMVSK